jgi:hypothetical protein
MLFVQSLNYYLKYDKLIPSFIVGYSSTFLQHSEFKAMKFNFVCLELTCGMVGGTGPGVPGKGRLLFSGPVGTGGGGGGGKTFLPFCCG